MEESSKTLNNNHRLMGFKIGNVQYAIPVLEVQEVIHVLPLTNVPLAPDYIKGLINLRGQIVTSLSLRSLFQLEDPDKEEYMNIIVRLEDSLYSLIVDEIMDVIDVKDDIFEKPPETLNDHIRKYIGGVYKLENNLLILLDLEKILSIENKKS